MEDFMDFPELEAEAAALLAAAGGARDRLQAFCDLMKARVPHYDWFGFYIARRGERLLDLGPFAGEPTEHTLIPFGRGICGQAAAGRETLIVDDVSAASNYLACSLKVKSEIVVPVLSPASGEVAGEIDIDSHRAAAFSVGDRHFLERAAVLVAADVEALRRRV
jgi:GAF domain-containing protein